MLRSVDGHIWENSHIVNEICSRRSFRFPVAVVAHNNARTILNVVHPDIPYVLFYYLISLLYSFLFPF